MIPHLLGGHHPKTPQKIGPKNHGTLQWMNLYSRGVFVSSNEPLDWGVFGFVGLDTYIPTKNSSLPVKHVGKRSFSVWECRVSSVFACLFWGNFTFTSNSKADSVFHQPFPMPFEERLSFIIILIETTNIQKDGSTFMNKTAVDYIIHNIPVETLYIYLLFLIP